MYEWGCKHCGAGVEGQPHLHWDDGTVVCLDCSGYSLEEFRSIQQYTAKHRKYGKHMKGAKAQFHATHPDEMPGWKP